MAARLALGAIRAYRRVVSPHLPPSCRFVPTCSEYGMESIGRFGLFRGGWLLLKRLMKCHPLCRGGYDPVPGDRRDRREDE